MTADGRPIFGDGTCARPGCPDSCRENQLMCVRHWYLVPRPLRTKVWLTFRAYSRGYGTLAALRDAQNEAVAAVVARSTS